MEYNGIEIVIVRKYNKNTYFRYKDNSIYVTTNNKISDKEIFDYIKNNFDTLSKKLMKNKENISKNEENKLKLFGVEYEFEHRLYDHYKYEIRNNKIIIYYNDKTDLDKAIKRFYRAEIKNAILDVERRYYKIFNKYNLVRDKLSIKKMSTQWGSCNKYKRSITINELLAKIDIKYLEYVLCHEYAHLEQANHSNDFYVLLEKLYPEHRRVSKELKSFTI